MELYENEHEQAEALQAWLKQHGMHLFIAFIILVASIGGWRSWQEHKMREAEDASGLYMKLTEVVQSKPADALEIGRQLIGSHPGSSYASMASMAMANINLEKGDKEAAAAQLRWVVEKGQMAELKEIARLRLGRLLLDMGKADEALATIAKSENASFHAAFDELRGDILLSQGKRAEARNAYANALAGFNDVPSKQSLLQMKIDDLADAQGSNS